MSAVLCKYVGRFERRLERGPEGNVIEQHTMGLASTPSDGGSPL